MDAKFIVFEGMDGSGKSTQFSLFCKKLRERGLEVVETREPTREMIGDLISRRLKSRNELPSRTDGLIYTLLFYADRIDHNFLIQRELQAGKTVVSDRYYHSTLAYQKTQGFDTRFILDLHNRLVEMGHVRIPDMTFIIDVPAEIAVYRIDGRVSEKKKVEIFEHLDFLKKLRDNYLKLGELLDEKIVVIDGTGTKEDVWGRIEKYI